MNDLRERFSRMIYEGLENIAKEDASVQEQYLDIIAKEIRNCPVGVFQEGDAFFVPNNDYMRTCFGDTALRREFDLYDSDGECKFLHRVVFPVYDVLDQIVGIIGYSPIEAEKWKNVDYDNPPDDLGDKYVYSAKSLMARGKYLFAPKGTYRKALEDGYAVVIDGTFDCLYLNYLGINAFSTLGSISDERVLYQLSFIPRLYNAYDNDEAGKQSYEKLKKFLPNIMPITQGKTKDIDDYIKLVGEKEFVQTLKRGINSPIPMAIKLR